MKDLVGKITSSKLRMGIVGGAAALVLVVIIAIVVMSGGDPDSDLIVDFNDPQFADPAGLPPVDGGAGGTFVGGLSVEEQVEQTVAAMRPTETPAPTPDIGATLAAEHQATRVAQVPAFEKDPLRPQMGLDPYLTEREIRYMAEMGNAIWAATSMWMHLRQVVYRDVSEWGKDSVDIHMALAGTELQVVEARWERIMEDVSDNESISDEVKSYILQLEDAVRSLRSVYRQLETTRALLKSVDGDLEVAEREAVAQAKSEIGLGMDRFVQVMSRYGCAVCGELVRQSGG